MLRGLLVSFCLFIHALGQGTVDRIGSCGGDFNALTGSLASPNYGLGPYPNDVECRWSITAPQDKIIKLVFETMDVEADVLCVFDGIMIYDNTPGLVPDITRYENSKDLLGQTRYCGRRQVDPIWSTTNSVKIIFYSDSDVGGDGFKINWEAIDIPEDQFDCDFEYGFCFGWTHVGFPDANFDWTLHEGNTKTPATGPIADHTFDNQTGQYVFIETSAPRVANDTAILSSPEISFIAGEEKMCISFWYHMLGATVGSLAVAQTVNDVSTVLWLKNGAQGQKWIEGNVELEYREEPFKIMFVGVRGQGFTGDIAIDDVKHELKPCPVSVPEPTPTESLNETLIVPPPPPSEISCTENEYKCISGSRCIPDEFKCDGYADCPDDDDELQCNATTGVCLYGDMCGDGSCIELWKVCDGVDDCDDASDELNCTAQETVVVDTTAMKSTEMSVETTKTPTTSFSATEEVVMTLDETTVKGGVVEVVNNLDNSTDETLTSFTTKAEVVETERPETEISTSTTTTTSTSSTEPDMEKQEIQTTSKSDFMTDAATTLAAVETTSEDLKTTSVENVMASSTSTSTETTTTSPPTSSFTATSTVSLISSTTVDFGLEITSTEAEKLPTVDSSTQVSEEMVKTEPDMPHATTEFTPSQNATAKQDFIVNSNTVDNIAETTKGSGFANLRSMSFSALLLQSAVAIILAKYLTEWR
ncbi:uncharacterized protein LOC143467328 isoform X2 [Clavelina lepadiformis]|uniref:uncharacterized protein LOC143467328 isoform X2 n=1 Tax=Clavelina lepadiformis TaxID=159417 RepID=UPI004041D66D